MKKKIGQKYKRSVDTSARKKREKGALGNESEKLRKRRLKYENKVKK